MVCLTEHDNCLHNLCVFVLMTRVQLGRVVAIILRTILLIEKKVFFVVKTENNIR